ncbi:MAG: sulfatase, partial [Rikenellaceae bacterium]
SSPARGMMMSGMYPFGNKVIGNCNSENTPYGVELLKEAICWSDVLKDKGYSTGYIGKWHLDSPREPYIDCSNNKGGLAWNEWCEPSRRHGFTYWHAYGTYDSHLRPLYWDTNSARNEFFYVDQWGPEYETNKAIEFIKNQTSDKPYALVVSMNPPHTGYNLVPDKYKKLYTDLNTDLIAEANPAIPAKGTAMGNHFRKNVRDYYACISGVDENIGRLIDYLKQTNQFNNTIIVFSSDHGNCLGAHGEVTKNNYYEESMKVPFIITYGKNIKPRIDTTTLIAFQDIYPTVLSMMGFEKEIPKSVETFNLASAVKGKSATLPEFQPYYKINAKEPTSGWRGLRTLRHTYAVRYEKGKVVEKILFDRQTDPYELNNIVASQPKTEQELHKKLIAWLKKTSDPLAI